MKAIVTGLNGTLAPVLAMRLQQEGVEVIGWQRNQVSPDQTEQVQAFLEQTAPDMLFHLAMGSEQWAAQLASYCQSRQVPFAFTSTAMVFDHNPDGPHMLEHERTSQDDYGQYKIRCEDSIRGASDQAIIARIGWQIHHQADGNNMLAALHRMADENGHIDASTQWYPATSWMADTADMLLRLVQAGRPGTYHLDSNAQSRLNFVQIVEGLKERFNTDWEIRPNQDYQHDQRLVDPVLQMPPLFR